MKNYVGHLSDDADLEERVESFRDPVNRGVNTVRADAVGEEVRNRTENCENAP
jgi:hypothetical protein